MREVERSHKIVNSNNSSRYSALYPRTGILKLPGLNLRLFWLIAMLLALSLMVFYIFQSNWLIRDGYLVDSFESRLADMNKENKKLEINFVQSSSLGTIEERIKSLNFVEVNRINYIQLLGGQVAAK